jgi:YD repeat-containing protein
LRAAPRRAVTVWNYDSDSGLLTSKRYHDNTGPNYAYHTSATNPGEHHLSSRTWARGRVTAYTYNAAGEVSAMTYNAGPATPNLYFTYDRLGRLATVVQGTITTTLHYNEVGQLTGESYSGGDLNGLSLTNRFDALFRRTNNASFASGNPRS